MWLVPRKFIGGSWSSCLKSDAAWPCIVMDRIRWIVWWCHSHTERDTQMISGSPDEVPPIVASGQFAIVLRSHKTCRSFGKVDFFGVVARWIWIKWSSKWRSQWLSFSSPPLVPWLGDSISIQRRIHCPLRCAIRMVGEEIGMIDCRRGLI